MSMPAEVVELVIGVDTRALLATITVPADADGHQRLLELADTHGGLRSSSSTARCARHAAAGRSSMIDAGRRVDPQQAAWAVLPAGRRSAVDAAATAQRQLRALVITVPEQVRARFRGHSIRAMIELASRVRPAAAVVDVEVFIVLSTRRPGPAHLHPGNRIRRSRTRDPGDRARSGRPDLLDLTGVGPIVAAIVLTAWSHPGRCRSDAAFAMLADVAPIPASAGKTVRCRLSRSGDRQLNRALHTILLSRLRYDEHTLTYADSAAATARPTGRSSAASSTTSPARSTASSRTRPHQPPAPLDTPLTHPAPFPADAFADANELASVLDSVHFQWHKIEHMFAVEFETHPPEEEDFDWARFEQLIARDTQRIPPRAVPTPSIRPSGASAAHLDSGTAEPGSLTDDEVIDAITGFERVIAWAGARQARLLAEFAARRPAENPAEMSRWAPDEIALALSQSRITATAKLAQSVHLHEVLGDTLHAWETGRLDALKVRAISDATLRLDHTKARAVQNRVLPRATQQTLSQLRSALKRAVLTVDPDGGNERHGQAKKERRIVLTPVEDGMATLWAFLTAPDAQACYGWLTALARGLGKHDPRGMDARRADLLRDLLTGHLTIISTDNDTTTVPGPTTPGETTAEARAETGADPTAAGGDSSVRRSLIMAPAAPGARARTGHHRRRPGGHRRSRPGNPSSRSSSPSPHWPATTTNPSSSSATAPSPPTWPAPSPPTRSGNAS